VQNGVKIIVVLRKWGMIHFIGITSII